MGYIPVGCNEYNYAGKLSSDMLSSLLIETNADEIILNKREYIHSASTMYPYSVAIKITIDDDIEDRNILLVKDNNVVCTVKDHRMI